MSFVMRITAITAWPWRLQTAHDSGEVVNGRLRGFVHIRRVQLSLDVETQNEQESNVEFAS